MKTIYLECNMGASGDMLMASLLELYGDQETFLRTMNGLGLPGVEVRSGTHRYWMWILPEFSVFPLCLVWQRNMSVQFRL